MELDLKKGADQILPSIGLLAKQTGPRETQEVCAFQASMQGLFTGHLGEEIPETPRKR